MSALIRSHRPPAIRVEGIKSTTAAMSQKPEKFLWRSRTPDRKKLTSVTVHVSGARSLFDGICCSILAAVREQCYRSRIATTQRNDGTSGLDDGLKSSLRDFLLCDTQQFVTIRRAMRVCRHPLP